MKLRPFCVVAVLFAVAGAAHAADAGKKDDDIGGKKLTIPSVEMSGGSVGLSGSQPDNPDVPAINDPQKQDKPLEPYFGLKFTKPLDGK